MILHVIVTNLSHSHMITCHNRKTIEDLERNDIIIVCLTHIDLETNI